MGAGGWGLVKEVFHGATMSSTQRQIALMTTQHANPPIKTQATVDKRGDHESCY